MTVFLLLAAVLVAGTVFLFLRPLLRGGEAPTQTDQSAANLAIFRDQLADLERERAEGALTEADFASAQAELQRRLLEEAVPEAAAAEAPVRRPERTTAAVLALCLPVVALGGYVLLGNPLALDPAQTAPRQQVTAQQVEDMVGKLAARLKEQPDDAKGWVMLARSYKVLGRHAEAAEAYGKGMSLVAQQASLLADYAEVLAMAQEGNLQGRPSELIAQALKLDPDEPQALLLAGAAASDRMDFAAAATHWERLLKQLAPDSDEAKSLSAAVAKAREIARGAPPARGGR